MILPIKCPKKDCKSKTFFLDACLEDVSGNIVDIQIVCSNCGCAFFMRPRAKLELEITMDKMSPLRSEIIEQLKESIKTIEKEGTART